MRARKIHGSIQFVPDTSVPQNLEPVGNGKFRYNELLKEFEGSDGVKWIPFNLSGSILPFPIQYTFSGTLAEEPIIVITTPPSRLHGLPDYAGKWALTLILSSANIGLTKITFSDIQGLYGDFIVSDLLVINSLNFPALLIVNGIFSPNTMPGITTLGFSALASVLGTFSPNDMVGLTVMSFPALINIGDNFSPNTLDAVTTFSFLALETIVGNFNPNTMAGLTSMNFPALISIGNNFNPSTMVALTSMFFPTLITIGNNFNPNVMAGLTNMNFTALKVVNSNFTPNSMVALVLLNFPVLNYIGGNFSPSYMNGLTIFSLEALTNVGGDFTPNTMAAVTVFNTPQLLKIGGDFGPSLMNSLVSITMESLNEIVGQFSISNMAGLLSVNLPAIEKIDSSALDHASIAITSGTPGLININISDKIKQIGVGVGDVLITSAALNQLSVDNLFLLLASLDGTNDTSEFSNRLVVVTGTSMSPSIASSSARDILKLRGCTIRTN